MTDMVSIVIAFRRNENTKTRLAGMLSEEERLALADGMFSHLVRQVHRAVPNSTLFILSPDRPQGEGAVWIKDEGRGLNEALMSARDFLPQCPTIFLPADLPIATVASLRILSGLASQRDVVIAPDRHEEGTNALSLSRPGIIPTHFGKMSFGLHKRASLAAGIAPHIFRSADLELDLDTPADFAIYQQGRDIRRYA